MNDYVCGNCGKDIEDPAAGVCPHCGDEYEPIGDPIPWDDRGEIGFLSAFLSTCMLTLNRPTEFFRTRTMEPGLFGPLFFAWIIGLITTWISLGWQVVLPWDMFGEAYEQQNIELFENVTLYTSLFAPVIVPITLILSAGIIHLFLSILGSANQGFEETFKAVSYSQAPSFLVVIPYAGGFIATIWMLALEVIAVRELHDITTGRAAAAVLLPLALLFFCCCLIFSVMIISGIDPEGFQ